MSRVEKLYRKVQIGKFLKRIKRPVELSSEKDYMLVTVKLNHKGVVLREIKKGSLIQSKMFEVKEGDFILSGIDARNGAFGIVPKELDGAIVTNDFWYFEIDSSIIDKHFFLELTSTSWFDDICRKGSDGTTQRIRLQKDKFFNQEISLPSPSEQKAFIEKFLNVKSINTTLSCEISNQLNILKKLRQSILQEAIEGKLTAKWREENPTAEPASVLLEKIKAEKEKLVRDGKIKKEKPLPEIKADEIPFDIPESWSWCRLGSLIEIRSGNVYGYSVRQSGEIPYVKVGDMNLQENKTEIITSSVFFDSSEVYEKDLIPLNSIIFPKRGGAIATNKKKKVLQVRILIDSNTMSITIPKNIEFEYIFNWFSSVNLASLGKEGVIPQVNNIDINPLVLPMPPLDEQKAIVEKIENLFAMCDELEEQIKASKSNTETLMQSILKEAFEKKVISRN